MRDRSALARRRMSLDNSALDGPSNGCANSSLPGGLMVYLPLRSSRGLLTRGRTHPPDGLAGDNFELLKAGWHDHEAASLEAAMDWHPALSRHRGWLRAVERQRAMARWSCAETLIDCRAQGEERAQDVQGQLHSRHDSGGGSHGHERERPVSVAAQLQSGVRQGHHHKCASKGSHLLYLCPNPWLCTTRRLVVRTGLPDVQ
jgi:hypothetical protein